MYHKKIQEPSHNYINTEGQNYTYKIPNTEWQSQAIGSNLNNTFSKVITKIKTHEKENQTLAASYDCLHKHKRLCLNC